MLAIGSVAAGETRSAASTDDFSGPYIIVLKDSVDHPGAVAEAQTEQRGGNLDVVYRHALTGYAATLPKNEINSLRDDPRVAYVTADHKATILEEEVKLETENNGGVEIFEATIPTGINRIFATANKALSMDGKDNLRADVDVAVIDTGIDYEHPDLNVVARTNCITGICVDNTGKDGHSHGTHVAGTIGAIDNGEGVVGVASGARMWAVKVLNDGGSGAESWIIAGVDWVTAHAKDIEVANMSLGCFCSMPALDKAINGSVEAGVVYAVAAGNSNANASSVSPASNANVITVSALADYDGKSGAKSSPTCQNYGLDDRKASFSNYGSTIEIAAPGTCILSAEPGNKYGYKSGTSMAAPHVAGAVAVLASESNPSSKKDVEALRASLLKAGNFNWTDTSGDGLQEPLLDVSSEATFTLGGPPKVTTLAANSGQAKLSGIVNPNGSSTNYHFEYGINTSYGTSVPIPDKSAGSGTSDVEVSQIVEGLEGSTTYHFRVTATNSHGTTYGEDKSFTTPEWTIQPAAEPSGSYPMLASISCLSSEVCVAVGSYTNGSGELVPLANVKSAGKWSLTSTPKPAGSTETALNEVFCDAANSCIAVGHAFYEPVTLAERWNGSGWTIQSTPNQTGAKYSRLTGIACPAANNCIAVGYSGDGAGHYSTLVERWNGIFWTIIPSANPEGFQQARLYDISCISVSDCWAVGGARKEIFKPEVALAEHWNGASWAVNSPEMSVYLGDVSCASSSSCVAVRNNDRILARWNGSTWSQETAPAAEDALSGSGSLSGIACTSASACIATGEYRNTSLQRLPLAESWNGSKWSVQTTSSLAGAEDANLIGTSCTSATSCTAVGFYHPKEPARKVLVETRH